MVVAVEVRGKLEPEQLRAALDQAQVRHPLLAVNTEPGDSGLPWFSSQGVAPIPLRVFTEDRPGAPLTFAESELTLTVQHVIADGLSMVFLVRDLLRWVEDPHLELPVLDASARADDLLPERARRRVATSARRFRLVLALMELYARLRRWLGRNHRSTPSLRRELHHRTWVLTAEQTRRLRERCRREGVSVHAALCTAFLPGFPAVHTPINLRPFLRRPVGEAVGLFVGSAEVKLRYRSKLGFWHNARRFRRRLLRGLRDPFGLFRLFSKAVPVELVQKLGPLMVDLMSGGRPFGITNLGDLDASGLGLSRGTLKIESFFGAVMGIVDSSVVTACTLEGRLRLHLLAAESPLRPTAIRDDGARAVARLLAALDD